MKKLFSLIYILLLCAVITGCSSAGGISTFTIGVEKMGTNFDPQIAADSSDLLVLTNIFDGLFEKQDGQIVKNIAETCDISSDGKTYTITIKGEYKPTLMDSLTGEITDYPATYYNGNTILNWECYGFLL